MSKSDRILFSAVRNEGPFLLEWIAYHKAIGFNRIIIVSNDSTDGTTELLNALDEEGHIKHIHHSVPENASPQGHAAAAGNASGLFADGAWMIWLDADEFLNIHAGKGHLDDLIKAIEPAEGMLIPWRIFGDSGNKTFPGRFISEKFDRASTKGFGPNATIKAFFRYREGATRLGERANHRPRLIDRTRYSAEDFVTTSGAAIDKDFPIHQRWLSGVEGNANFKIAPGEMSWDIAQINHYMVRTRDVYDLKKIRGRGFRKIKGGKRVLVDRHTADFYVKHNKNSETDVSILRHSAEVGQALDKLLQVKKIKKVHLSTIDKSNAQLKALKEKETISVAENPEPAADAGKTAPVLNVPTMALPAAEAKLIEKLYADSDVILEYGSGGSTLVAAGQKHSCVVSVESDKAWAENLTAVLARDFPDAPVHVHWENIGVTKGWGRPKGSRDWRNFHRYPLAVWDASFFKHPDLVLIDGRFRVGCFMATLLRITRPVTVLFDDYTPRPHYARVERFAKPQEIIGRMARFQLKPMTLAPDSLTDVISWFNDSE